MSYTITSNAYAVGTIKSVKREHGNIFIAYVQLGCGETMVQVPNETTGKKYFATYADANMAGRGYYLTNAKPGTLY